MRLRDLSAIRTAAESNERCHFKLISFCCSREGADGRPVPVAAVPEPRRVPPAALRPLPLRVHGHRLPRRQLRDRRVHCLSADFWSLTFQRNMQGNGHQTDIFDPHCICLLEIYELSDLPSSVPAVRGRKRVRHPGRLPARLHHHLSHSQLSHSRSPQEMRTRARLELRYFRT